MKITPPTDFFSFTEPEVDLAKVKSKLVERKILGKTFLIIALNETVSRSSLVDELKKLGITSYKEKAVRLLEDLEELGIISVKRFKEAHSFTSPIDQVILTKHQAFLNSINNTYNNSYEETYYYFLNECGENILPFIAKKFNFKCEQD
jgi:hypothetical protein